MKLGGHLRSADGMRHMVVAARGLQYGLIQTMLSPERDYAPREVTAKDAAEFKKFSYGIDFYVHLPYVINPCEEEKKRQTFYRHAFRQHARTAAMLGARGLILHPGFKKEMTEMQAETNLMKFIEAVIEDETPPLLLETDSGSKNGSKVGSLDFIGDLIDEMQHPKVGMCIDTVHLYARGIDVWDPTVREEFLEPHARKIRLVHLNSPDPECTLGSKLDRHNTPFEDRPSWDHLSLFKWIDERNFPAVLERSSIQVQERDVKYINSLLSPTLTRGSNRSIIKSDSPRTKDNQEPCQLSLVSTSLEQRSKD